MKVMYWNCTAPAAGDNTFSKAKLDMIAARVLTVQPDILCLDEVSKNVASVAAAQSWANDMGLKDYTAKVLSPNPGFHLNMVVFVGPTLAGGKVAEGIPDTDWAGDRTKRNLIRVAWTDEKTARLLSVWFLHANASAVGGKTAVDLALAAIGGTNSLFMGDFNNGCALAAQAAAAAKATVFPPTAKVVKGLAYSQWTKGLTPQNGDPAYRMTDILSFTPNAQGCIDFALGKNQITAKAIDALYGLSPADYGQLMNNVDHIPIAYDVQTIG